MMRDSVLMMDDDFAAMESYSFDLTRLLGAHNALESYGSDPAAMGVLSACGLLASTALDGVALESYGFDKPSGDETKMALEALGEKIKDTTAKWAAKIVSMTKTAADKVGSILDAVWTKITQTADTLLSKTWDKTKEATAVIKAHPYKTIAIAVGTVIGVCATAAFVASKISGAYANETALESFQHAVQNKVNALKWPFGKITTVATRDGKSFKCVVETVEQYDSASAKALGWTKATVKSVIDNLKDVKGLMLKAFYHIGKTASKGLDLLVKAMLKIDNLGEKVLHKVEKATGNKVAGIGAGVATIILLRAALNISLGLLISLIIEVIKKTFILIGRTFHALALAVF
jgi:ElaB/YqjD/DUF883 family membrane-anchored ribosome-binding protein